MNNNSYSKNSRTKIADLCEKNVIEDTNLIIVEDKEDTKRATIHELKKALTGDVSEPDTLKFYSSKKVDDIIRMQSIEIAKKAKSSDVDELEKRLDSIVIDQGSVDGVSPVEIMDARNGYNTLGERLRKDRDLNDKKYVHNLPRSIVGNHQQIKGNGEVDILISNQANAGAPLSGILAIRGKNLINFRQATFVDFPDGYKTGWEMNEEDNGYIYTPNQNTGNSDDSLYINLAKPLSLNVSYILYCEIESTLQNCKLGIYYTNANRSNLHFTVIRPTASFNNIFPVIIPPVVNGGCNQIVLGMIKDVHGAIPSGSVKFSNIALYNKMAPYPDAFSPYYENTINCAGQTVFSLNNFRNDYYDYDYSSLVSDEQMVISYYDTTVDMQYFYNEIEKINKTIDDKTDKCGLITDYGTYQYLDNLAVYENEDWVHLSWSDDYSRNGKPSRKITIDKNAKGNSIMRLPIENPIEVIETVSVCFYIDKTVSSIFSIDRGGLKIRLHSDNIRYPSMVNYYEYLITKDEMVQGWNFIKKRIQDFNKPDGSTPNPNNIQYISIEVCRNDEMNGLSLYLNSFVFNQKMKPTVMLCFDGTWDTSISYLYPFMQSKGVKGTVFLNQDRTLTPETVDNILKYKIEYGWDIGLESCHPNKDILFWDNNYRNQYMALLNGKEWLKNTIVSSPVSFSAPVGNLRPLTANILKDMGFKMARTGANGYCSFFSDKDFSLPSYLIYRDTKEEDVYSMIDYAIETGQTLVLYTTDVTEYGGDVIAKTLIFERIVDYISRRMADDERHIDCLSFSEFYNKCVN